MKSPQTPLCSRTFGAALILTAGVLNVPAMYFLSAKALSLYSQFTGPDIAAQQEAARDNFLQNCTSFSQHTGSDCNFKCTAVPASTASMYTCQWCATPPDGANLPPPWDQNACVGTMNVSGSDPLPLVSDPSLCTKDACNGSCSTCQYGAGNPSLVLLACVSCAARHSTHMCTRAAQTNTATKHCLTQPQPHTTTGGGGVRLVPAARR